MHKNKYTFPSTYNKVFTYKQYTHTHTHTLTHTHTHEHTHTLTHTHTLRQGLSVCAPTIVNPLPGVYLPPTANAMIVEKLLVKKYCATEEGGRERERNDQVYTGNCNVQCTTFRHVVYGR